jgi:hypothetical protein
MSANEDVEMKDVDEEEEDEDDVASDLNPEEGMFPFLSTCLFLFLQLSKMRKMRTTTTERPKMKMRHSRL